MSLCCPNCGHQIQLAEPSQASQATPSHLNSASTLPPVDCPLIIEVWTEIGDEVIAELVKVIRPAFVSDKANDLTYLELLEEPHIRLITPSGVQVELNADGTERREPRTFIGRFRWTYP